MANCWAKNPDCRPTFRCLVTRVEQCSVHDMSVGTHMPLTHSLSYPALDNDLRQPLAPKLSLFSNQSYDHSEDIPLMDENSVRMSGVSGYLAPIEDENSGDEMGEEENDPLTAPVFEFESETTNPSAVIIV